MSRSGSRRALNGVGACRKTTGLVMGLDFLRIERAIVKGRLINLSFEIGEVVAASTDEDGFFVGRERDIRLTGNLRGGIPVEINPHLAAFPHEGDVVPGAPGNIGMPGKNVHALVAVEENQFVVSFRQHAAADAEMIACGGSVSIGSPGSEITRYGAGVVGEAIPEPKLDGVILAQLQHGG